jgi:hypothetical protein
MSALDQPHDEMPPSTDYFLVAIERGFWRVSPLMAKHIEAQLDQERTPGWVVFVDLAGSRIRILSTEIQFIEQSYAEYREYNRRLRAQIKREDPEG